MLPKVLEDLDRRRPEEPDAVAEELQEIWPKLKETREIDLAYGIMGSCLRHKGEISAAIFLIDKGLEKATEEWDRASLLQRRSMATSAKGDFESAFSESDQAILGYIRCGDADGMGRVMTNQATWWYHKGSYHECINALRVARILLLETNLHSRFVCHQGSALAHLELGDMESCVKHLEKAGPLAIQLGRVANSRFLWLQAKIYERFGELKLAESSIRIARDGFLVAGEYFDAALASVALVDNLLAQERIADATEEGITCRRFVLLLPESNHANSIMATVWKRSEAHRLTRSFLKSAVRALENGHHGSSSRPAG